MKNPVGDRRGCRRFQFSVRTLLIIVVLLAIPLGWVGWQAKIVRNRQALLMRVISRGGEYCVTEMASRERFYRSKRQP